MSRNCIKSIFFLRKDNIIKKLKYVASAFNAQSDPGVATKYIIISSLGKFS